MGDCYNHLTRKDRAFIRIMLDKHYSKAKIAQILGVHKSTIYREIERNSWIHPCSKTKHYTPGTAQNNYMKRRKRQLSLNKNAKLRAYVISKLLKGWSPWQIEGRLRMKNAGVVSYLTKAFIATYTAHQGLETRYLRSLGVSTSLE